MKRRFWFSSGVLAAVFMVVLGLLLVQWQVWYRLKVDNVQANAKLMQHQQLVHDGQTHARLWQQYHREYQSQQQLIDQPHSREAQLAEMLLLIKQSWQLSALDSRLGKPHLMIQSPLESDSTLQVLQTVQQLSLSLAHEGQFLAVMDLLADSGLGVLSVDECLLESPTPLVLSPDADNIKVHCTLRWLDVLGDIQNG